MGQPRASIWRLILRSGLLGSMVALYLAAIGMVETFSQRPLIGGFLSLGQVLYTAGAVGAGIMTARALREKSIRQALGASVAAGAVSSFFPLLLVAVINQFVILPAGQEQVFVVRDMFPNFSPGLVDMLTFKQGLGLGSLLLVLVSGALGALGFSFVLMRGPVRLGLINGLAWTIGIGIFSENVAQVIQQIFGQILGRSIVRVVFAQKALNPAAAAAIFVGAFLVAYFRVDRRMTSRWQKLPPSQQQRSRLAGVVLAIVLLLLLPWILGLFLSQATFMIGLYVMMGLGLNIVVGYAGLLDLGYVAFFAFGAYVMGVLTSTGPLGISNLNFWTALPVCIVAGVLWGLLLGFPVLRMRGDYLAIVTLGFGEIVRILATSDWLAPIEGGPQGVLHIPFPTFFGLQMNSPQTMYYLVVLGSLLAMFVTVRLRDSRLGRQWMAMREDEDVAEAMGINLISTKLLAFAIGAAFSAMAGGIFAARLGNIFPHSLNLLWSINALSLIIVGGLGSIPGVVVGAIILVGLPEILREFTEYRLLMYGILLIVVMLMKPEGFIPEEARKRELRAGAEEVPTLPERQLGALGSGQD